MDFNFPEILAQDLGVSEDAFRSKSMTAGPPLHKRLASESKEALIGLPSTVTPGPDARHSLDLTEAIDARQRSNDQEDAPASEMDTVSSAGSDSTDFDEPPSIRFRQSFVPTAATSVASAPRSASFSHSLTQTPPKATLIDHKGSWVDFDTEETIIDSGHAAEPSPREQLLRYRPNSTLGFTEAQRAFSLSYASDRARRAEFCRSFDGSTQGLAFQRSHTFTGSSTMGQPFILAGPPFVPSRRSSLSHTGRKQPRSPGGNLLRSQGVSPTPAPKTAQHQPNEREADASTETHVLDLLEIDDDADEDLVTPNTTAKFEDPEARSESTELSEVDDLPELPPTDQRKIGSAERRQTDDTQGSPTSIHVWLENSVRPGSPTRMFSPSSQPGIPLPPEVIDNLRVSINCFPETMLLSSSLTIETIRAYAKKLKQTGQWNGGNDMEPPLPSSPGTQAGKFGRFGRFPKLLSRRTSQIFNKPPSQSLTTLAGTPLAEPQWLKLRNVFCTGSDYLCDALYAHIVAYNYIGSLCPDTPATSNPTLAPSASLPSRTPSVSRRPRDMDGDNGDGTRVPKKAASLLGLSGATASGGVEATHKLRRLRRGGPSANNPEKTGVTSRQAALADVHALLGCCVTRLIATLKMTEEFGVVALYSPEMKEVDPFLVRSLCEMVRISEDAV